MADGLGTLRNVIVQYGFDVVLLVILFLVAQIFVAYLPTFDRFVVEKDPALSFPYVDPETVNDTQLFGYCGILPLVLVWITQGIVTKWWPNHQLIQDPVRPTIAMLQTWGFELLIVNWMKRFTGRPRPNFFAYCDYKGYREALTSGNFSQYDAATLMGRPILASACISSDNDPRHSFPSGHASFSMCSLLFLALFWGGIAELQQDHRMWKMFVCVVPILMAWVVAGTRTRDYYHNFEDILAGVVIGSLSAIACFVVNFNVRSRLIAEKNKEASAEANPVAAERSV